LLRRIAGPGDAVRVVGDAMDAFAEAIQDDAAMLVLRREQEGDPSMALDTGSRQGAAQEIE
jgi:hypothetical protein